MQYGPLSRPVSQTWSQLTFEASLTEWSLELECVVLIEDGLFWLSEMYFRIISIAKDGSSGIGAKTFNLSVYWLV